MSQCKRLIYLVLLLCVFCCLRVPARAETVTDFTGDKKSDILWRNNSTGDVVLWTMNGANILAQSYISQGVLLQWQIVGEGDFNGDGKADILWRNTLSGDVVLWQMNGSNILSQSYVSQGVLLQWQVAGLGDFTGDGKADILWRNSSTGDVVLWTMSGANILAQSYVSQGVSTQWQIVGVGDFNNDGSAGILWHHVSTGDVVLWTMSGANVVAQSYVRAGVALDWRVAGTGDFNGDGRTDVLWRNFSTGDVVLWTMNGPTILTDSFVSHSVLLQWQVAGLGDFTGDGKADILWRNSSTGDVVLWTMSGANILAQSYVSQGVSTQWQVAQPAPASPYQVYGLNFSPYTQPGQDPNNGSTVISQSQIDSLLQTLRGYTQWVRTFGTQNGLENIPARAHRQGFKTMIGAYIGTNATVNNAQIANLVAAAQAGNVDIAIVGNEYLLQNDSDPQAEAKLLAYIQQVKAQIPNIPVTYADTWDEIVNRHPNIINAVDVVAVNIYPFYENATIDQAVSRLQQDYALTVQAANGKPVLITETGWPSSGSPVSFSPNAIPSAANAAAYFNAAENWARSANVPIFYFETFDEPYKGNYSDYPSWGLWDVNTLLKPGMISVFQR